MNADILAEVALRHIDRMRDDWVFAEYWFAMRIMALEAIEETN
jgi:hypothetical protein